MSLNSFSNKISQKRRILAGTLKHLNGRNVLRAKILTQNILERQIFTNFIDVLRRIPFCFYENIEYSTELSVQNTPFTKTSYRAL